jgi:hypothetical protein
MPPNQSSFQNKLNTWAIGLPEKEYLGYWITRKGIQPVQSKAEAILKIKAPTTRKELRHLLA